MRTKSLTTSRRRAPSLRMSIRRVMLGTSHQLLSGPFARAFGTTLLANSLFLVLAVVVPADPGVVANRVRTAFETGELGTADYLPFDSRRGWHQYNDCITLQM